MTGGEEKFAEVAGDNLFFIADGSEVERAFQCWSISMYIDICWS